MFGLLCALLGACVVATVPPPPAPVVARPPTLAEAPVKLPPQVAAEQPEPDAAEGGPAELGAHAPGAEVPALAEPAIPAAPSTTPPAWERFAVAAPPAGGRPTLTLIIDDCGVNLNQTARAVVLPGPLTLSWLPYSTHLADQIAAGGAHGHETMLHMPMEALGRMYPGPGTLRTWLPPETNLSNLRAALDAVPGAVALNQHEGSVASLSVPLMDLVMAELQARGVAFIDSLTIPHSVALKRAEAAGLPSAGRDLFIDNDPNPAAIRARLAEVEGIARRSGHAIFIGHPRVTTMDVLEQYLPGVAARGFVLWPVSATIALENHIQIAAAPPPPGTAGLAGSVAP